MIRDAKPSDINKIYPLCLRAIAASPIYSQITPDELTIRKRISQAVSGPQVFCKVSEVNGAIVGLLAGTIETLFFSKEKVASDLMYFVEQGCDAHGLLREFRAWAISKGVSMAGVTVSFGGDDIDRTGKLIEQAGFKRAGGVYLETY